jgi:zinc/manganese transport system permease protein
MTDLLSAPFIQIAFLAGLILAGIHAYLGFHIVSRGVIFVDLSLAQAAAFGSVVALVLGWDPHGQIGYFISLAFTFIGAGIISIARTRGERVPQEAFIGIVYAGFSAAVILLLAHRSEGTEELQHMLAGSLLTVSPNELLKIAILYAGIGFFHWLLRKKFFMLSESRDQAIQEGVNTSLWDFLFYVSFGVVVTSSVEIAGVLLVFSLLVIPPSAALLLTTVRIKRLFLGWGIGVLGTLGGVLLSIKGDLPTGPSIIMALIFLLLVAILILRLLSSSQHLSKRPVSSSHKN